MKFAIGINPKSRVTGNPYRKGKKFAGSVHMTIGTGIPGGMFRSTSHLGGLMLKPLVSIDGKILSKGG